MAPKKAATKKAALKKAPAKKAPVSSKKIAKASKKAVKKEVKAAAVVAAAAEGQPAAPQTVRQRGALCHWPLERGQQVQGTDGAGAGRRAACGLASLVTVG